MEFDWLSRLLDLIPVQGHLDIRCFYGAPWKLPQAAAEEGVIPYHIVVGGSAVVEVHDVPDSVPLSVGDMLILPHGSAHLLHDGSGARAKSAHTRSIQNLLISENAGTGDRLDMLCGRFVIASPHDRLLKNYLPARIVVRSSSATVGKSAHTTAQLTNLVSLMRTESAGENLGGRALLNSLSTAIFALALRQASEMQAPPVGLLGLAAHPRLVPVLNAMLNSPARTWTLPQLARLCHMSRATLARQFDDALGRSANQLLTDIRMSMAANELAKPSATTASVAANVGYQSEAAFQRAFKQNIGVTPAQWRRRSRTS